ncbi:Serine/threonine-protein kinase [Galdieria sulphuraria]|uniref:Serine/threonine protein kinase isoform 1 n=1 Tax=Galdieria sulphuraria TaxID=130081 RepID=M2W747_GALSU|nr:serine/threonine protein kinase isoform 2 [Galdieria sulphuraria]XP_005708157.1 serine/threonine protein kinase isoform 1 [Galdieria sulphuraria]EME31636.1 serine/threonine protein kinase isoform 2 [Galdieria sulphuraria]EME31637.1 serine/threonine protein kinase isoform 1 [Galdieria sulphuraria]GJD10431.1 Serine/threonine-protein kinase [Galdieria sulphuraria]|eukprot:XP_005708156.1 serine/threonine protein kinase isoform 2 [Galdieria sulphuraria]
MQSCPSQRKEGTFKAKIDEIDELEPPDYEVSSVRREKFQRYLEQSVQLNTVNEPSQLCHSDLECKESNNFAVLNSLFHQLSFSGKVSDFQSTSDSSNVSVEQRREKPSARVSLLEKMAALLCGVEVSWKYRILWKNRAKLLLDEGLENILLEPLNGGNTIVRVIPFENILYFEHKQNYVSFSLKWGEKIRLLFIKEENASYFYHSLVRLLSQSLKSEDCKKSHMNSFSEWVDGSWKNKPLLQKRVLNHDIILLQKIGQGKYGKVKLSFSIRRRRFVAVKKIYKQKLLSSFQTKTGVEKLLTECKVMMKLRHPNILRLYELYDDPKLNCFYLVMEYACRGPIMRLQDNRNVTTLKEDVLRRIIFQVVQALCYIHSQGITHNDLKPDNILMCNNLVVKLGDFGESDYFSDSESNNDWPTRLQGTPAMCAPELCLTSDKCPSTSFQYRFAPDVWSLGATTFFLATGHIPFEGQNLFEMYEFICVKPLIFPQSPRLSDSLQSFIRHAMTKDPPGRPTIFELQEHPWLQASISHDKKR